MVLQFDEIVDILYVFPFLNTLAINQLKIKLSKYYTAAENISPTPQDPSCVLEK